MDSISKMQKKINKLNRAIIFSETNDLILLTALAFIECERREICDDVYKLKDTIKKKLANQQK